ncbi:MAG: hypothetical protein IPK15_08550 [Verrucomicrobia bacterium]|nr:hypothetical protein [Verrucomicrobiota bacterium]
MELHKPTKDERDFVQVVKFSTALGLGLMAAFLYSLKQVHPNIVLEFGFGTVLAFLVTAVFSWLFCNVLFKGEFDEGDSAQATALKKRRVTRWVIFFIVVSSLLTAGAFLYSLKDLATDSRRDVIQGAGFAVFVLSIGGFFIHKSVRFFEEQDRINMELAREREEEERDDLK